ncbi:hypothetical protein JG687_00007072 [Phytophthora cactorum]|uniref:J domain-containing protein n=1 Tax=Phytophthora cactorum TaxID=29920 RepID=A0A8T1UIG2_9STRA|nr:hypothetical protein JG687_00007072 [Phytophthora cactorum]
MCGRARCTLAREEVAEAAGVAPEEFVDGDKYKPVENMGPGRYGPILLQRGGAKAESETKMKTRLQAMRWGLIPSFAKANAKPDHFLMFNARYQSTRLEDRYYEWQQVDKREKQPYYFYRDGIPMKFAGLYDQWKNEAGELMCTYTILTTAVAPELKWLHTRMPVILSDEGVDRWLSGAKFEDLKDLLASYRSTDLKWHPVDRKVGSMQFQSEDCAKKVNIKHAGDIKAFFGVKPEQQQEAEISSPTTLATQVKTEEGTFSDTTASSPFKKEEHDKNPDSTTPKEEFKQFSTKFPHYLPQYEIRTTPTSSMEMNKGEAEKCLEFGKKHLRIGNWEKAIKFFDKSHRMYPLPGVEAMRDRAKAEMEKASTPNAQPTSPRGGSSSSAGVRHRTAAAAPSRSPSSEPSRPYTAEQLQVVRKIKSCKTHYEVLSVQQTATENEVKKAYRKLALKLHPDKNSAPGAEDAFKAVGKAFAVLSDPDKRAHYDRYGDEAPVQQQQHHGRRYAQEDDITPEEIFNMFFGGGFRPRGRRPQQHQGHGHQQEQRGGMANLAQFLPLLLIFLMSLLSIPSTPEMPFSLNPTPQFNVQRATQMANVVKGIPYYVERDFEQRYTTHWRDLSRVEQMVEQAHVSKLSESCENLKLRQKRMIYRARNSRSEDREAAMRKALEMKMPPCDELRKLRRTRRY